MALDAVQDFILSWPGRAKLSIAAQDESSGQGSGVTLVKELRSPLWWLRAESRLLRPTIFNQWEARLDSLENGKLLLVGRDKTRCYPSAYPSGSWPTGGAFSGSAAIHTVGGDFKSIRLKNLPAGYVGTVGDLFSFVYAGTGYALHRVAEAFVADGSGITGTFEIRPHIRAGAAANDVVLVKNPYCRMRLVPGSYQAEATLEGWGVVTFEAMQAF